MTPVDPPTLIVLSNCAEPSKVDIPVVLKLRVTISTPIIDVDADPDVTTLIPLTKRLLPSKRKLLLSVSYPPLPA